MVDMAQADRTLWTQRSSNEHNEGVFARHRERVKKLMEEWDELTVNPTDYDLEPLVNKHNGS